MLGIGLSVAVLLDATIVRMMIVPAVMSLLDRRAWHLPTWLDRTLPNLDIEGVHLMHELDQAEPGQSAAAADERDLEHLC